MIFLFMWNSHWMTCILFTYSHPRPRALGNKTRGSCWGALPADSSGTCPASLRAQTDIWVLSVLGSQGGSGRAEVSPSCQTTPLCSLFFPGCPTVVLEDFTMHGGLGGMGRSPFCSWLYLHLHALFILFTPSASSLLFAQTQQAKSGLPFNPAVSPSPSTTERTASCLAAIAERIFSLHARRTQWPAFSTLGSAHAKDKNKRMWKTLKVIPWFILQSCYKVLFECQMSNIIFSFSLHFSVPILSSL
jgi:hypothetical protein